MIGSKPTRDAIRAAATSAWWVFLGMFATSLLGWLTKLSEWATSNDAAIVFPDPSVLVKALLAAVVAGITFVVAAIVRLAQKHAGFPGKPPTYPTAP